MAKTSAKKKTASKAPAKNAVKAKKKILAKKVSKKKVMAKKAVKPAKKVAAKAVAKKSAKKVVAKKKPVVKKAVAMKQVKVKSVKKNVPSLAEQLALQLEHKKALSPSTAAIIDKGHAISDVTKPGHVVKEDKRSIARHEHIHQFASRTPEQH